MSRRRNEFQILTDVLSISLGGVKFTHLMYKANLSYSTLRKYLFAALKKGLIRKNSDHDGDVYYFTTEGGVTLLQKLRDIQKILHG